MADLQAHHTASSADCACFPTTSWAEEIRHQLQTMHRSSIAAQKLQLRVAARCGAQTCSIYPSVSSEGILAPDSASPPEAHLQPLLLTCSCEDNESVFCHSREAVHPQLPNEGQGCIRISLKTPVHTSARQGRSKPCTTGQQCVTPQAGRQSSPHGGRSR